MATITGGHGAAPAPHKINVPAGQPFDIDGRRFVHPTLAQNMSYVGTGDKFAAEMADRGFLEVLEDGRIVPLASPEPAPPPAPRHPRPEPVPFDMPGEYVVRLDAGGYTGTVVREPESKQFRAWAYRADGTAALHGAGPTIAEACNRLCLALGL